MLIKSLTLTNFRNWDNLKLEFASVTILVGSNGVGKTNVVEAINLLSTGRSWRTNSDLETIGWEKEYARIVANLSDDKDLVLEMFLSRISTKGTPPKSVKINQVKHRILDLLGQMPAVLFSPETIQMLDGVPATRRKFLDIMLSEIDRNYALNLLEYTKVLKERNRLLYHIQTKKSKVDELEFWDQKLIENGTYIIEKREQALKYLNKTLNKNYQDICGSKEELVVRYKPSVEKERFGEILTAVVDNDINRGSTGHGPHRDDWMALLNNKDVTIFGSRGEYRSVILALKMAELEYIGEQRQEKPVLLLDDIFSELDSERRKHLAEIVMKQQTIITTTDLDHIEKGLREKAKIIEL